VVNPLIAIATKHNARDPWKRQCEPIPIPTPNQS